MDMDAIMIGIAAVWMAAAAACMLGRSQPVQRVGCMEFLLTAAVGGCALFGYLKAADFMTGQYHQMLAISLENTAPYLADLEDELEVYGGNDEAFLQEAERIVEDALPVIEAGDARYSFCNVFLVKRDGPGVYRERFSAGSGDADWESLQAAAIPLIGQAHRDRRIVWQAYEGETTVFAAADQSRVAPAYALIVLASKQPLVMALETLKRQYFTYSLLFLIAATQLIVMTVMLQEKELHRIRLLLSRLAKGREETASFLKAAEKSAFHKSSNEIQAFHSSLKQIAMNTERLHYAKYQVLQAYYRFAPKEIEKILGKQSILDVAPMDQAQTEGTVAFVSFAERDSLSTEEYLRRMKKNYAFLCEGRREFGGSIVPNGSDPDVMLLLFYDESGQALRFGIRMAGREAAEQTGQAFVFLHRTSLVYGVAGDEEQSFPYLYSEEIHILQKYTDDLRAMGVRMVVTAAAWEEEKEEAQSRYIGYIEDGGYRFSLYEILDVHPAPERDRRLKLMPRFKQALELYYQSDFYLARNLFSEILRSCPMDEVAKWYLFLCENGLQSGKTKRQSFGLFSGK